MIPKLSQVITKSSQDPPFFAHNSVASGVRRKCHEYKFKICARSTSSQNIIKIGWLTKKLQVIETKAVIWL